MELGLIYDLNLLFSLLVLVHVLYHRRPAQTLIIWLLVVMLLPWIGALFYLAFGSRKVFARHPKPRLDFDATSVPAADVPLQHALFRLGEANGLPQPTRGNRLMFTTEPDTARSWLFDACRKARRTIHLETYIFRADGTGRALLDLLAERAREGVKVRLLVDAFGSMGAYLRRGFFRPLLEAGGEVVFFQPLGSLLQSRINLRNHRKLYLFDERLLIAGGINIGDEYLAPHPQAWADLTFRIEGPVLAHYARTFAADWLYATGQALKPHPQADSDGAATAVVQAVPSGPDMPADTLREALACAFHRAERRIEIVTPYFIPDQFVLEAVLMALKRGVRVRLLTPERTDHRIFDWGREPYMRELVEAGADVRCLPHRMLHAKMVLVDDALAMIGSANLDFRSLLLNYEIATFCFDDDTLRRLDEIIETLAAPSTRHHPPDSRIKRVRENLIRIITPAL